MKEMGPETKHKCPNLTKLILLQEHEKSVIYNRLP